MTQTQIADGSLVLLQRVNEGWWVWACYPIGLTAPPSAIPTRPHFARSLEKVRELFSTHHLDHEQKGGHPAAPDPTSNEKGVLPPGTVIEVAARKGGWLPIARFPGGGIGQRMAPYTTFAEVLKGLNLLYDVE